MPKPAVPHYRLDTPLETEKGLPSVTEDPPADPPAAAPRESLPAQSGSTVLIPDVENQPVEFGAVEVIQRPVRKARGQEQMSRN